MPADLAEVRRWRCQVDQARNRVAALKADLERAECRLRGARSRYDDATKEAKGG